MKAMIALVALAFATGGAFAAEGQKEPSPAQKAQQEKMKTCNAEASEKALKGDARKQFMSTCLKKDAPAAPAERGLERAPTAGLEEMAVLLRGHERVPFRRGRGVVNGEGDGHGRTDLGSGCTCFLVRGGFDHGGYDTIARVSRGDCGVAKRTTREGESDRWR